MASRLAFLLRSSATLLVSVTACGGTTESPSTRGGALTDAGTGGSSMAGGASNGGASNGGASNGGASNGGASNGGASNGGGGQGQGGHATGGVTSMGGVSSTGGAGSTGGASGTGGAAADAGPCNVCLPNYDLHWGPNGGLVAWIESSQLGPCASYTHRRDPAVTDPPSLICNVTISSCPGSALAGIIEAIGSPAFDAALNAHTLYGNDPRPVDGQVFRIGVGNDYIDIGPTCEQDPSNCPTMPEAVARLAKLLRDLDTSMLAAEPCKGVFGN